MHKSAVSKFILVFCVGGFAGTTPLTTVHPDWTRINLRVGAAAGFQPRVSGLDFLSNGDLVVGHWGGIHDNVALAQVNSIVYILSGVTGNAPSPTVRTFATGIEDLMGLAVVSDQIYVSGGNKVVQLLDANGDGISDGTRIICSVPYTPGIGIHQRHEFTFGLTQRSGTFYMNVSSTKLDLTPADLIRSPNRGTSMSVNPTTGAFSVIASGLREPTGLGFGPNGDLFSGDVAGNWVPTNKLIHVQQGHFYGFHHTPDAAYAGLTVPPFESQPESPPAVYMPDEELTYGMAAAVSNPLYVTTGPYAGQMLMGDVHYGGIQRYFLEKVNNEYQGAVFQFTGGLEVGMFRLAWGPDGMLYAGGLADNGDWNWGPQAFGLQKLRYNGTTNAYEMLAVRSRPGGLEIEFNKPIGATASVAANYSVQSMIVTSTINYANDPTGVRTDAVGAIQVCSDNRRVFLPVANFTAGRIYYLRVPGFATFQAADNSVLWTRETVYANNAMGSGAACSAVPVVDPKLAHAALLNRLQWSVEGNNLIVRSPFRGSHEIKLLDLRGSVLATSSGFGPSLHSFSLSGVRGRFAVVEAVGDGTRLRRAVNLP